jgi:hypothetical protein
MGRLRPSRFSSSEGGWGECPRMNGCVGICPIAGFWKCRRFCSKRIRGLLRETVGTCIEDESMKLYAIGPLCSTRLCPGFWLLDLRLIDRRQFPHQKYRAVD